MLSNLIFFRRKNEKFCEKIKSKLKSFYDFVKDNEIRKYESSTVSKLIVDGFDTEQVWQQIDLQNSQVLENYISIVSKLVVAKDKLRLKNNAAEENEEEEIEAADSDSEELQSDEDLAPSEDLESEGNNEVTDEGKDLPKRPKPVKPSIVDDEFFKLDEMEQFLKAEEKKLNDPDSGNDSENSEDETSSVDLFEAQSEEDEEDKMKTARYKDFFTVKDDKIEKKHRNKFQDDIEIEDIPKSAFEERQVRLNRKIEEIEHQATEEKPWQLKGEITAENRPQNSLLEQVLEFDMSTRPAPVITEETTLQLEDIIKQRIKDKVFDSVERKARPIETPLEYKKKLVLDQEKSKKSLAQIYEQEFLDQSAALDPENADKDEEEPDLHKEINSMMKSLFVKLDSLSNFHFTPKAAVPDLRIISNLPAISMEEVAPVSTSDAQLLAPEEIKGKAKGGDLLAKSERSTTDKNRERRKKKLKQKIHAKKKLEKEKHLLGKNKKDDKEKPVKNLKDKNVNQVKFYFLLAIAFRFILTII